MAKFILGVLLGGSSWGLRRLPPEQRFSDCTRRGWTAGERFAWPNTTEASEAQPTDLILGALNLSR